MLIIYKKWKHKMSKVIYAESTDIGATLTTYIYVAFWEMWAAEQLGIDTYINWPDGFQPGRCLRDLIDKEKFSEEPNMYNWFFKQPKVDNPPLRDRSDVWTWQSWKDPSPVGFMAQPLSVIKEYYKKNLIFNDVVNARGQALVDKYKIDFKNTIGISWRGTDAQTDGRVRLSISVYYRFIDEILAQNPNARIACTAEEEEIIDPLLAKYPQAFRIEEFYSSPFGDLRNPERFSPMSGYERGMQPALIVWLFSKCAWYIKNRSSTGAVASWLSSGKIYNIAHAETLNYDKLDDQVEIEGQRYPLYR
jgi:hypothetical protein